MSDKKVIGILGGMGPLTTADLFQKITLHTAASCDQDHPRVCIDSTTNISDRTAALLHGGADPVPEMVKSAQRLESIGADLLIMPCNTAHNFYDAVASSVSIPVLHMIAITRDALKSAALGAPVSSRPTAPSRPASTSARSRAVASSSSPPTTPKINPPSWTSSTTASRPATSRMT